MRYIIKQLELVYNKIIARTAYHIQIMKQFISIIEGKLLYLLICSLFLITACQNKQKTNVYLIDSYFKKQHGISDGNLIVMYDLLDNNKHSNIFNCDYAKILNDKSNYTAFIQVVGNKSYNISKINKVAYDRVLKLRKLLLDLNRTYSFPPSHQQRLIEHNSFHNKGQYLQELSYIDSLISNIPLMIPLPYSRITSNYGFRKIGRKKHKFHQGLDIQSQHHALIFAPGNGIVTKVARHRSYGNIVEIKHANNLVTRYAHLHTIHVKIGDQLVRGEIIGTQGRTGNARGEHLHYEILQSNTSINPQKFIKHYFGN